MYNQSALSDRHIVLANYGNDKLHWACSHCEWETPYYVGESRDAVDPVEVVSKYELHGCHQYRADKSVTRI